MSRARDNLRKEKMAKRIVIALAEGTLTQEDLDQRRRVKNQIKSGKIPQFHLVKGSDPTTTDKATGLPKFKIKRMMYNTKTKEAEPVYGGLKFIQVSSMDILTKKIPQLKD